MGFPPAANAFTEHSTDLLQAGLPGSKALTSKRSEAKLRLGTPHKNMNLWLKSLLSASLSGQYLIFLLFRETTLPQHWIGGHFTSWQWSTGGAHALVQWVASWKGNIPPGYPPCAVCIRQSRLSFLPPFIAFSGAVNPPFHNSATAIAKLPGAASFAMMGRDFQSFASKRATVPMSGRWGNQ